MKTDINEIAVADLPQEELDKRLFLVKLTHTIVWTVYMLVFLYILYCGIFDDITFWTYAAIAFVIIEVIVLLTFGWKCPLTIIGYKYSHYREIGFDIFIPNRWAEYNKLICTILFIAELTLLTYRWLT